MTSRQKKAIAALLTEPTREAAAQKAGIASSTLRSYFSDPEFAEAYTEAFNGLMDDAARFARRSLSPALDCLREIVEDERQLPTAKIQAARALLEYGLRLVELNDVIRELDRIESGGR